MIKYTDNMWNVPDAAAAIRDYASQGFDIVIAHGSQFGSSVQEIAKDFPKVTFAWGTDVNTYGLPNVYAYTAAAEEGGYVNGVLAAKLSKSKKVGVTGPIEVGDAKTYIDGFAQGLAAVDKFHRRIEDLDRLLLRRGPHDRRRPDAHRERRRRAHRLLAVRGRLHRRGEGQGRRALVRYSSRPGLPSPLPSSSRARVYDWTGMLKDILAKRKAGTLGGIAYTLTLQNGGLKIAYNPAYKLPAAAKKAADAAAKAIAKGTLKVQP